MTFMGSGKEERGRRESKEQSDMAEWKRDLEGGSPYIGLWVILTSLGLIFLLFPGFVEQLNDNQ